MLDYTEPCGPWLIVIDKMDYDQAGELGKTMGKRGLTGRFMRGTVADNMADLAKRKKQDKEGICGEREAR